MSDGPPMGYRRITLPYFRTCSTCSSPSQARLCHCTLRTVAIRAERTLGSLRYSFGGDHPSQTTHQAVSFLQVRTQTQEGWYFNLRLIAIWRPRLEASHLSYTSYVQTQR